MSKKLIEDIENLPAMFLRVNGITLKADRILYFAIIHRSFVMRWVTWINLTTILYRASER